MPTASRRRPGLAVLAALIVAAVGELLATVALKVVSPRLVEPILRTPAIYALQSKQIQAIFFSDTARALMFDPQLGWKYRPGWRDENTVLNSAGLRGEREYQPVARDGVVRVAAFGDSFVYGNEARTPDSWPALMEQADSQLEVLNFGVGGYGVDQAYLRFLREGRRFAPSIVLICFTTDDIRRVVNVYRRFISITELPLFKPRFQLTPEGQLRLLPNPLHTVEDYRGLLADPSGVRRFGREDQWYEPLVYDNPAYDWSAVVRLSSALWIRLANRHFRRDRVLADGRLNPASAAFGLQVAIFQAFRDSVAASGARPVVLLLPDHESVTARAAGGQTLYAPLAARLDSLNIPVLDAGDGFAQASGGHAIDDWFMPGGHYSREGNLVVARWLTPRLHELTTDRP